MRLYACFDFVYAFFCIFHMRLLVCKKAALKKLREKEEGSLFRYSFKHALTGVELPGRGIVQTV
ncbi:hypothetical protein DS330_06175 [Salmonella enterica subsp. diarizonae]|uniref:Uncharacterized protein n=1 Tax=Salmonella enteritidis TaxID=149539 RepID=A0A3R0Q2R0_SALEN|nr:hypothetical protein [Salmonella enterica subsp. diarizonae]ECJ4763476.1 hypothetical protein [Salmonella enterica subsp. diarizonae]MJY17063.1 hypothetical protein [Salmonella enterica subsp. enterica serovar Enteritidis]